MKTMMTTMKTMTTTTTTTKTTTKTMTTGGMTTSKNGVERVSAIVATAAMSDPLVELLQVRLASYQAYR